MTNILETVSENGIGKNDAIWKMSSLIDDIRQKVLEASTNLSYEDLSDLCSLEPDWLENFFLANTTNKVTSNDILSLLSLLDKPFSDEKYAEFVKLRELLTGGELSLSCVKPETLSKLDYQEGVDNKKMKKHNGNLNPQQLQKFYPFSDKEVCLEAKNYMAEYYFNVLDLVMKANNMFYISEVIRLVGVKESIVNFNTVDKLVRACTLKEILYAIQKLFSYIPVQEQEGYKREINKSFESLTGLLFEKKFLNSRDEIYSFLSLQMSSIDFEYPSDLFFLKIYFMEKINQKISCPENEVPKLENFIKIPDQTKVGHLFSMLGVEGQKITGRMYDKFGFSSAMAYLNETYKLNSVLRDLIEKTKLDESDLVKKVPNFSLKVTAVSRLISGSVFVGYQSAVKNIHALEDYLFGELRTSVIKKNEEVQKKEIVNSSPRTSKSLKSLLSMLVPEKITVRGLVKHIPELKRTNLQRVLKHNHQLGEEIESRYIQLLEAKFSDSLLQTCSSIESSPWKGLYCKKFSEYGFDSEESFEKEVLKVHEEIVKLLRELIPQKFSSIPVLCSTDNGLKKRSLYRIFSERKVIGYVTAVDSLRILREIVSSLTIQAEDLTMVSDEKESVVPNNFVDGDAEDKNIVIDSKKPSEIDIPTVKVNTVQENSDVLPVTTHLSTLGGVVIEGRPRYILTQETIRVIQSEMTEKIESSVIALIKGACEYFRYSMNLAFQIDDIQSRERIAKAIDSEIREVLLICDIYKQKFPFHAMEFAEAQRKQWDQFCQTFNGSSKK